MDVETGVHTAIRKIRQALRDSLEEPAFVETISGKGYRFIAAVEVVPSRCPPASGPTRSRPPADGGRHAAVRSAEASVPATPKPSRLVRAAWAGRRLPALLAWGLLGPRRRASASLPRGPALREPGERSRAGLRGRRPHRGNRRVPRPGRPGTPERQGSHPSLQGHDQDLAEVGQELAVDFLVESSIRAEGGRLRVTATLIRVRDQEHVWSETYEREPTSLLGFQQELSTAIAEQVRLRVLPDPLGRFGGRQTQNADAYDAYLRGRYLEKRRTPETNARAIEEYDRRSPSIRTTPWPGPTGHDLRRGHPERGCPPARHGASGAGGGHPRPRANRTSPRPSWPWVRPLGFRLGLEGGGGRLPSGDRARSQQRHCAHDGGTRSRRWAATAKRNPSCVARGSSSRWSP